VTDAPDEKKRPMTLAEAGRKGGEKVKKERGLDFYAEIGRKGGRRVAKEHGAAFYAEIGRKGGEARRGTDAKAEPEPDADQENTG
jgi:general stress protein YciG